MKKAFFVLTAVLLLASLHGCSSVPDHWYGAYDEDDYGTYVVVLTEDLYVVDFNGNKHSGPYETVNDTTLRIKDESNIGRVDIEIKLQKDKLTMNGTATLLDDTLQIIVYTLDNIAFNQRTPIAVTELAGTTWFCVTITPNDADASMERDVISPYQRPVAFSEGSGEWGYAALEKDPFAYEIREDMLYLSFEAFDTGVSGRVEDNTLILEFPDYTVLYYQ